MDELVERVIKRLNEKNKCGRYSDATVESTIREVITDKELEAIGKKVREYAKEKVEEEDKEPLTLEEIIKQTPIKLDSKYSQVLLVAEDEEGICSICVGNPAGPQDRLAFYLMLKNKLPEIMLEGIPNTIVRLFEELYEK